ncbi:hypothetical protein [Seonamhaeicola maritimus]|uniref:Uncharacterized protein n=1 Tax=Seonamhaeicola maritimus TaxID=2591822 RepID=A0A5C7GM18_9FLAO|nr:hypothetical protein [Seonamhaeicola maritimus]TXG39334.1 hypothetical protein FUA22_05510 [Seonamhaeicola maritimus]
MSINKLNFILTVLCLLILMSCRREEMEFIQAPEEERLSKNSAIASSMKMIAINDGSDDNILDYSNCFNVKLPIEVTANGEIIDVKTKEDYKIVEYIFDDSDDDTDVLDITFPVTITLEDFREVIISNAEELASYSQNCNGENEFDDDIECIDFNYPILVSLFNPDRETFGVIKLDSDEGLYQFIDNLHDSDYMTLNFPITTTLFDNSTLNINSLNELEDAINTFSNACDEDDDYNFNDDDCDDCDTEMLASILTNCQSWTIDKLERYGNDLDDYYEGYTFNFHENGRVGAYWDGQNAYGTWEASGEANNITVIINIPGLNYCNKDWRLHEISEYNEVKVDFRVGYNDRLRYNNICD